MLCEVTSIFPFFFSGMVSDVVSWFEHNPSPEWGANMRTVFGIVALMTEIPSYDSFYVFARTAHIILMNNEVTDGVIRKHTYENRPFSRPEDALSDIF